MSHVVNNGEYGVYYLGTSDDCGVDVLEDKLKPLKPQPIDRIAKDNVFPCGLGKVTILLMTSPAARSAVPANNINNVINTAVAQLKFSLNNSYVDPDNLEIATVSPVVATSFVETVNIQNDVDDLDIDFEQTRVNNAADLVVMFTNGTLNSPTGVPGYDDFTGIAEDVGPNPDKPYAIVQILSATSKTFAHEVGHLLGGRLQTIKWGQLSTDRC